VLFICNSTSDVMNYSNSSNQVPAAQPAAGLSVETQLADAFQGGTTTHLLAILDRLSVKETLYNVYFPGMRCPCLFATSASRAAS
jgi:hypothetical protein